MPSWCDTNYTNMFGDLLLSITFLFIYFLSICNMKITPVVNETHHLCDWDAGICRPVRLLSPSCDPGSQNIWISKILQLYKWNRIDTERNRWTTECHGNAAHNSECLITGDRPSVVSFWSSLMRGHWIKFIIRKWPETFSDCLVILASFQWIRTRHQNINSLLVVTNREHCVESVQANIWAKAEYEFSNHLIQTTVYSHTHSSTLTMRIIVTIQKSNWRKYSNHSWYKSASLLINS